MKIKDIAANNGFDSYKFENFAFANFPDVAKTGFSNSVIDDKYVDEVVEAYKKQCESARMKSEMLKREEARLAEIGRAHV